MQTHRARDAPVVGGRRATAHNYDRERGAVARREARLDAHLVGEATERIQLNVGDRVGPQAGRVGVAEARLRVEESQDVRIMLALVKCGLTTVKV